MLYVQCTTSGPEGKSAHSPNHLSNAIIMEAVYYLGSVSVCASFCAEVWEKLCATHTNDT